jgi:hypothetical protein
MSDYLKKNIEYWSKGYVAENVKSFLFRQSIWSVQTLYYYSDADLETRLMSLYN